MPVKTTGGKKKILHQEMLIDLLKGLQQLWHSVIQIGENKFFVVVVDRKLLLLCRKKVSVACTIQII